MSELQYEFYGEDNLCDLFLKKVVQFIDKVPTTPVGVTDLLNRLQDESIKHPDVKLQIRDVENDLVKILQDGVWYDSDNEIEHM